MKTILVDANEVFTVIGVGICEPLFELLETYPNAKVVLSNASDDQFEKYSLNNLPYPLFTLKHTPKKAEPAYYEKLLEHLKLSASDVIYFEHVPEAIKSAESVGITTYFYDPTLKDLIALKAFLDRNL
jgi:FMN phosphatase YigB (HAD superfamily)